MQSMILFVEKSIYTHTCTYTHAHTNQCHTLDFTKFTAEEVNSQNQIVLNLLKSFPINRVIVLNLNLNSFKLNFNEIKQNLNVVKN